MPDDLTAILEKLDRWAVPEASTPRSTVHTIQVILNGRFYALPDLERLVAALPAIRAFVEAADELAKPGLPYAAYGQYDEARAALAKALEGK